MTQSYDLRQTVEVGNTLVGGFITVSNLSGSPTQISGVTNSWSVNIRNQSGNGLMWVGGVGNNAAASGSFIPLYPGDSVEVRINNPSNLTLFGSLSGQTANWWAIQ